MRDNEDKTSPTEAWAKVQDYLPGYGSPKQYRQAGEKHIAKLTDEQRELLKTWLKIGRQNPWIRQAIDPPFNEMSFYFCADLRELTERLLHGNWTLGQAYVLSPREPEHAAENEGHLCFINQINGGDEWLTIKNRTAFESITMQTFQESHEQAAARLERTVDRIQKATDAQCRKLKY